MSNEHVPATADEIRRSLHNEPESMEQKAVEQAKWFTTRSMDKDALDPQTQTAARGDWGD